MVKIERWAFHLVGASLVAASFAPPLPALADPLPNPASEPSSSPSGVAPPEVILSTQKPPEFPPAARAARYSGTVTVEATVLKDGVVGDVRVLACSRPNVGFEQATIDAVKQWRFQPAMQEATPVEYLMKFRLSFRGGGAAPHVTAGSFTHAEATTRVQTGSSGSSGVKRD